MDIGREFPAEPLTDGRPLYSSMRGPNLWPENLPEFKKNILELMQAMTDVGITILRAMAKSLRVVDEAAFMEMFNDDYCARMKLTRYPGMKNVADKPLDHGLGVGPHKVNMYLYQRTECYINRKLWRNKYLTYSYRIMDF